MTPDTLGPAADAAAVTEFVAFAAWWLASAGAHEGLAVEPLAAPPGVSEGPLEPFSPETRELARELVAEAFDAWCASGAPVLAMVTGAPVDEERRIERAVARLAAVELPDGRWSYYADETREWYAVTREELEALGAKLDATDSRERADAYSQWCAATPSRIIDDPRAWEGES